MKLKILKSLALSIPLFSASLFAEHDSVQDKSKGMTWGNIVFGGIIGVAVDRQTGAGCTYPQQNIVFPLQKVSAENDVNDIKKLKDLKELLDTGAITEDEFEKAKKQILN